VKARIKKNMSSDIDDNSTNDKTANDSSNINENDDGT
jgi:hypothetical protein